MGDGSAGLLQLRPVTFRYRPEYDDGAHLPQYGLIAEEVAEIYPELVIADSAGRPLTVRYHLLTAMLLNEVQRQHRLIQAQERRIQEQQTQLQTLAADHARLSERLGRLIGDATAASP
jgi:trimeric autotransporter adhesin